MFKPSRYPTVTFLCKTILYPTHYFQFVTLNFHAHEDILSSCLSLHRKLLLSPKTLSLRSRHTCCIASFSSETRCTVRHRVFAWTAPTNLGRHVLGYAILYCSSRRVGNDSNSNPPWTPQQAAVAIVSSFVASDASPAAGVCTVHGVYHTRPRSKNQQAKGKCCAHNIVSHCLKSATLTQLRNTTCT